ncbi:hypothetical protein H5368_01730 [Luteimonas sp. MC1782]|uniref:hypothetical protein n=1 Tax=Luteimonas sp. MC1782 TaxID=2760305 RepID=UPI0015FF5A70|nr:hypothetical protein [Luteimonas sp. MC1782]MBB1471744.1 hypothetical protein [Luteimonas sp. MC1782]
MRAEAISQEFGISEARAREIIGKETRRALLRRWQAWAWLLVMSGVAVALYLWQPGNAPGALVIGGGAMLVWYQIGRYFADPAVRVAARASPPVHGGRTPLA